MRTPRFFFLASLALVGCDSGSQPTGEAAAPADLAPALAELGTRVDGLTERIDALERRPTAAPPGPPAASGDDPGAQIAALTQRLDTLTQNLDAMQTTVTELGAAGSTPTPPTATTTTTTKGAVGVPECDDYLAYYRKCIEDKLPESVRETSLKALDASADAWKKAAATTAGKEALASACKTAREAVDSMCGP